MTQSTPSHRLHHSALEPGDGERLERATLTDRQRVAVLLQGAGLLSHLHRAKCRLLDGWQDAVVTDRGRLRVAATAGGRDRELAQTQLCALVSTLFSSERTVAGRGQARRAVRTLVEGWQQRLEPLAPDQAVREVLEAAPFLWQSGFRESRQTLLGHHLHNGETEPWVAGPPGYRARILTALEAGEEPETLFAARRFRELWCDQSDSEDADPLRLAADGHAARAVAVWNRWPPTTRAERTAFAQALFSLGLFERTLGLLQGRHRPEDRVLRLGCQYHLGKLSAAKASLRRLADADLDVEQVHDAAELAVRVLANAGRPRDLSFWVDRALAAGRGPARWRGRLIAASAAWDRGDVATMERQLEAARGAASDPTLAWRYHQLRALRAIARGDGTAAVDSMRKALGGGRKSLRRFEAGRLWNDMALARIEADDLPAAERACRHTLRLLGRCDGPAATTLALFNLAEVRIRRGRLAGVRDILERSSRENRLSGNVRGGAQDAELWARFELVRGDVEAALGHCRAALRTMEAENVDWNHAELQVFAARALGWLGRGAEAAAALDQTTPRARAQLEPEERPALWALAGERDRARRAAKRSALAPLWSCLLQDEEPNPGCWDLLSHLEPYRAARVVLDLELIRPGAVPPMWLNRAADTFRRVGAVGHADRLAAMAGGPWRALGTYLGKARRDRSAIRELLDVSGSANAALRWQPENEDREAVELVVSTGGAEELSTPVAGGRLVLSAPRIDTVLRTLFAVIASDWTDWLGEARSGSSEAESTPSTGRAHRSSGLVGECSALLLALQRIAALAPRSVPVLVLGETGTGKELIARQIHRSSLRRAAEFLPVNCAALSETLLLSDLFGHVRGSFTGADRDRAGVFETARGGTVFLDEIGDLPATAQGMLLRVLQEGEIRRLGESRARSVDVRVVAATHRDLPAMVADGEFRQDLYYRLKVATVALPPLRERGDDLWLLADHLLASLEQSADAGSTPRLSSSARSRLAAHRWPGNVRELKSVLEVAGALAAADGSAVIEPGHFDLPEAEASSTAPYHEQVEAFRRRLVAEALAQCGGNRAAAARRLGLSRQALSYLVRQLKLI